MTTYSFDDSVPKTTNNPSVDYITMQLNNVSTAGISNVDHIGYGLANGGTHRKCQFQNQLVIPVGLMSGFANIYGKLATEEALFFSPGSTGKEYQLTRTITASYPTFGTNTSYVAPVAPITAREGGWSFLAGNMLIQYGKLTKSSNFAGDTVTFPVAFTNNPYSVQVSPISFSSASVIVVQSVSTTGFVINGTGTSSIYWIAIGV